MDHLAVGEISEGLVSMRATGMELSRTAFLSLLADAYGEAGQPEAGLAVIAEALDAADKTGERFYEAELYRVRGDELLKLGVQKPESKVEEQAEACFRKAIEVARHQSAKSFELRATTSHARLLAKQDRRDEARTMLAEIYGWFTEGFDTADLKDAKALLDELNR
jgi:predicted ATPase